MQLYTKILIGMAVGLVLGLTLGPKSPLLEHDLYIVDSGAVTLYDVRPTDDPSAGKAPKPWQLPKGFELNLEVLESVYEDRVDRDGTSHRVTSWVRVRFDIPSRMRLVIDEPSGGFDGVEMWLQTQVTPLDAGGFLVTPTSVSRVGNTLIKWLRPVGEIFIRLIKMVIVPLVFASLVVGIAGLGDVRRLGRLGGRTLGLYMVTTAFAVTIGVGMAHVVSPGSKISEADREELRAAFAGQAGEKVDAASDSPSTLDNILNIIPENPIAPLTSNGQMLQVIFFAVLFGVALTFLERDRAGPVVRFFEVIQDAMVVIIHIAMKLAPFGVAALIAEVIGTTGVSVLLALLWYSLAVIAGLAIFAILVYGGLVRFVARVPFLAFLRAIRPAQLLGFSTSSSSATLPVTLECAQQNLGISKSVSSFVIPLGSTVNMDGTALYQGVAAIFIAQVFGMDLSLGAQLGIVLTATMASVGAAGVPGAGMVTLTMVLTSAGVSPSGIALILGMDRLLDMFRTAVNVTGDLAVTTVMATVEGEHIEPLTPAQDAADPERGFEGRFEHGEHPIGGPNPE